MDQSERNKVITNNNKYPPIQMYIIHIIIDEIFIRLSIESIYNSIYIYRYRYMCGYLHILQLLISC